MSKKKAAPRRKPVKKMHLPTVVAEQAEKAKVELPPPPEQSYTVIRMLPGQARKIADQLMRAAENNPTPCLNIDMVCSHGGEIERMTAPTWNLMVARTLLRAHNK